MNKKERRNFLHQVEYRADDTTDKSGLIEGVAAVVNVVTDMGWYKEMIVEGAFDEVLGNDIRCLVNHEDEMILARTKSGTLKVWIDEQGNFRYSYKTPNRSYAHDLEDAIISGDVSQSSFAFTVKEEQWVYASTPGDKDLRKIIKFEQIYDVSPVTFPAYEDTDVAKRSHQLQEKVQELKVDLSDIESKILILKAQIDES